MKTFRLKLSTITVIFGFSLLLSGCKDVQEGYPIRLNKLYGGKTVDTLCSCVSDYIKNVNNPNSLAEALYKRNKDFTGREVTRYDYQGIKINWNDTKTGELFTIHVADNEEFENEFTYETMNNSIEKEIGIFMPNTKYYYKVVGDESGESIVDSFIANPAVRYISADTVINVRDLGGWKTSSGKTLNYGKLYRGGALNEFPYASYLSEDARRVFEYLGIKGEIDLRGEDSSGSEEWTPAFYLNKINNSYPGLREGLKFFAYDQMTKDEKTAKNNLPKIFDFLGNEDNYPIFFHCSVGADRTGTLAYLIEGLLGVQFNNLMLDYELTSFTSHLIGEKRARARILTDNKGNHYFANPSSDDLSENYTRMWYCHELLMDKYSEYSTDISTVIEKYLLDMGVEQEDITNFKQIMLG